MLTRIPSKDLDQKISIILANNCHVRDLTAEGDQAIAVDEQTMAIDT
jgi:hypothetical protein